MIYDTASTQSTSDNTNMGWIWSGSCGAWGMQCLHTIMECMVVWYICMQLWHIHTFYLVFMVRPLLPSALHCQNSKKEREVILDLFFSLFSFTIYFQKIYSLSYPHVGSLNALWKHCLSLHHMIYLSSHMTCYLVMWSTHLGIKHLFSANGRYNDGSSSHKATVIVWLMHAWKHRCNYISSSLCCC